MSTTTSGSPHGNVLHHLVPDNWAGNSQLEPEHHGGAQEQVVADAAPLELEPPSTRARDRSSTRLYGLVEDICGRLYQVTLELQPIRQVARSEYGNWGRSLHVFPLVYFVGHKFFIRI